MLFLIGSLVILAVAYLFGIYCTTVIVSGLESQFQVRGRTITISPVLAVLVLILIVGLEVLVYYQIAIRQRVHDSIVMDLMHLYNQLWPITFGLFIGYLWACLRGASGARVTLLGFASYLLLPTLILLWAVAQWQMSAVLD